MPGPAAATAPELTSELASTENILTSNKKDEE